MSTGNDGPTLVRVLGGPVEGERFDANLAGVGGEDDSGRVVAGSGADGSWLRG